MTTISFWLNFYKFYNINNNIYGYNNLIFFKFINW